MFFMDYCFAGGRYSADTTPSSPESINSIMLAAGAYDDFYVTKNPNEPYSPIIEDVWDYDTLLHATFKNNLSAGNVTFMVDTTDAVRVKRRKIDAFDWVTLYEKPVQSAEDFTFEFFDNTFRSNIDYEYALVPIYGLAEGDFIVTKIKPFFRGVFISEKNEFFHTEIEVQVNAQQQNKPISVVPTMGKQYPFVISNGINNYKSGTLSAIFAELDTSNNRMCNLDFCNSWKYRERLNNFLYNGRPKLLKNEDGRMWIIAVSSSTIAESEDKHELIVRTSFDWTEIANCDKESDLYDNGLLSKDGATF